MKSFFVFLLLLPGFTALAQTSVHSNLNTEINDDDKTYSIRIDGDRNGKTIHYNRTFNVAGLNNDQKESLKNRVLDSLGLGETPPPPPRINNMPLSGPVPVTFTCTTCMGNARLSIQGKGFAADREVTIDKDKSGFPFELDMPPGEYVYTYWQNKVEQMKLPFTVKAGQANMVTVK